MDRYSEADRSRIMASVKAQNTKPELTVRKLIHAMGYRFRLHATDLPGKPDIVFRSRRKAIFVHGCFWHQHESCRKSTKPRRNKVFWGKKLDRNVQRDKENCDDLVAIGWSSLVIWECETTDLDCLRQRIVAFLES